MAEVVNYIIKPCKSGRTFPGRAFRVRVNGVAKNLNGVTINMNIGGTTFSNTTGEIVVTDAAEGRFQIKKQKITLAPYNYSYDITFDDGTDFNTYIEGSWRII
jgi:hypothetical protein